MSRCPRIAAAAAIPLIPPSKLDVYEHKIGAIVFGNAERVGSSARITGCRRDVLLGKEMVAHVPPAGTRLMTNPPPSWRDIAWTRSMPVPRCSSISVGWGTIPLPSSRIVNVTRSRVVRNSASTFPAARPWNACFRELSSNSLAIRLSKML